MSHIVFRSLLWSVVAAVAASQSAAVYSEDGPDGLDAVRDGLAAAGAVCAAFPGNPACVAAIIGTAALATTEGCWMYAMSHSQRRTMGYIHADYDQMTRVFDEMLEQMSGWKNVTQNHTSPELYEDLSVSSQAVIGYSHTFLGITDRAISQTMSRLQSTQGKLAVSSSFLLVVPGSSALRVSAPSMLLPLALLAMTLQGCWWDNHDQDQEAYDLLVEISSNMATAIQQVEGITKCVSNPYHVSCSPEELNSMITGSKADFKRLGGYMKRLEKVVYPEGAEALVASAPASPLQLSGPAAPAPRPSDASTLDGLRALLMEQGQMEEKAQKEIRRDQTYRTLVSVAALIACFCFVLSCVLAKRRVEEVRGAAGLQWQRPLPEQQQQQPGQQPLLLQLQQGQQQRQQPELQVRRTGSASERVATTAGQQATWRDAADVDAAAQATATGAGGDAAAAAPAATANLRRSGSASGAGSEPLQPREQSDAPAATGAGGDAAAAAPAATANLRRSGSASGAGSEPPQPREQSGAPASTIPDLRKVFTTPWVLAALFGMFSLSFSAYFKLVHLSVSTNPQASLDRLYSLDSYTQTTLTLVTAVNECRRFPCSSGYVNDNVDALVNMTVQLLTEMSEA